MANKAILFIDLLGVQKLWLTGGYTAVKDRIQRFNTFVLEQANFLPAQVHREGEYTVILAGDSVSIMCQDFEQAIGMGVHFFVQAFYSTGKTGKPFWLRGAIDRWHNQYLPVNTVPIHAKGLQIGTQYVNEDDYLKVLALEKSGFRGMRLIVDRNVLPGGGLDYQAAWSGLSKPLGLIARLNECTYPEGEGYADVLWMAADQEHKYGHMKAIMSQRFKRCTREPDEFVQAAWTRAVFDQVESLVWSCRQVATSSKGIPVSGVAADALSGDDGGAPGGTAEENTPGVSAHKPGDTDER